MTAYTYYIARHHHNVSPGEFLHVGIVVVRDETASTWHVPVDVGDARARAVGWKSKAHYSDFLPDWIMQFEPMNLEEIEHFRMKSYMSSLLLGERLAVVAETPGDAIESLRSVFFDWVDEYGLH